MKTLKLISTGPKQTENIGKALGKTLQGGEIICLYGDLGAGKTILVKGIVKGLRIKDMVKSPTFTLVNEYGGEKKVFHFDLYRIKSPLELEGIGFQEYLYSNAVSIIEWAEKAGEFLPSAFLEVKIQYSGKKKRELAFIVHGKSCR